MAENTIDYRGLPKLQAYAELKAQVDAVLAGIDDDVTAMATISCMVFQGFGPLWAGFYRVVEPGKLLRVGPYQGTLGCLEIAFGRGVCGTAAAKGKTILVPDVQAFPGHIACDGRARSEIVLPVHNASGALIAVFDVDSTEPNAFDAEDARGLEAVLGWFGRYLTSQVGL
jgi:L-methionine (R)-S-oxide reductase